MFRKKQTWAGERKLGLVHHNMGANHITWVCEQKHQRERGNFCPKAETSAREHHLLHESGNFSSRAASSARNQELQLESGNFCSRAASSARDQKLLPDARPDSASRPRKTLSLHLCHFFIPFHHLRISLFKLHKLVIGKIVCYNLVARIPDPLQH